MAATSTASPARARAGRRAPALPPDERRAALVAATAPVLAERGEAITTREIAAAAGVAEGTIFRVFADKDELLIATLEAALDPTRTEEAIRALDPELELVPALVEVVGLLVQRFAEAWRLLSAVGPRLRAEVSRPMADSPALIELFAAHVDRIRVGPVAAARMLRGFTFTSTHPMFTDEPLDAGEVVDSLLNGIGLGTEEVPR